MGGAALAGDMHVAGRPSPSHRRCPFVLVAIALSSSHRHVILDDVNVDVVIVNIVVVVTAGVFHFPNVVVAIAAIIVVGIVVVAVAAVVDIFACRRRACCAPWLSI